MSFPRKRESILIASATLDRYLRSIDQKQIYGTQYKTPLDGLATQEPYDRTLVSDALRETMGVRSQTEQEKMRAEIQAQRDAGAN